MPTYEYECEKCGHRFERFQKMTDPPERLCPECGGEARRLIGAGAGILFRGDGFYVTDYRSKEYREKAKSESRASSGEGKPDGKDAPAKKGAEAGKGGPASGEGPTKSKPSSSPDAAKPAPKKGD